MAKIKVWVSPEGDGPVIVRCCKTSNRMLYAIFFDSKDPVLQIPVPKGSSVTGKFYRESVLTRLVDFYQKRRPLTGVRGIKLFHDNAPAHNSILNQIQKHIKVLAKSGILVTFVWIPSHVGIIGNEIVDQMAKNGSRSGEFIDMKLSIKEMYHLIEQKIKLQLREVELKPYKNKYELSVSSTSLNFRDQLRLLEIPVINRCTLVFPETKFALAIRSAVFTYLINIGRINTL